MKILILDSITLGDDISLDKLKELGEVITLCLPSVWPILSQQRSNAQVFCVLPHQMLPNQLTLPVGFWYNAFRHFC